MHKNARRWYQDQALWPLLALSASVKIAVVWLAADVFYHSAWFGHISVDVWGWNDFLSKCQRGLIPYVDFSKEYPVGAGLLYWGLSRFLPAQYSSHQLLFGHAAFMAVGDVINTGIFYILARQLNTRRAGWITLLFLFTPTALILSPVRFETWVITFSLLGYCFHRKERPGWAVFFWSLGASIKWYPVFFIGIQELHAIFAKKRKTQWLRSAGIFLAVSCALNLPFILWSYRTLGNANNWLATYLFHLRRPLYSDTLLGVGELWFGRWRWETYASYWSGFLVLGTLLFRPKMRLEYKAVLTCLAAILFNRIYSTQFHLWFYPFLLFVLCLEEERRIKLFLGVFLGLDLLNISVYPFLFTASINELRGFAPLAARRHGGVATALFTVAVCLRALVLILLAVLVASGPEEKAEIQAASAPASASPQP